MQGGQGRTWLGIHVFILLKPQSQSVRHGAASQAHPTAGHPCPNRLAIPLAGRATSARPQSPSLGNACCQLHVPTHSSRPDLAELDRVRPRALGGCHHHTRPVAGPPPAEVLVLMLAHLDTWALPGKLMEKRLAISLVVAVPGDEPCPLPVGLAKAAVVDDHRLRVELCLPRLEG